MRTIIRAALLSVASCLILASTAQATPLGQTNAFPLPDPGSPWSYGIASGPDNAMWFTMFTQNKIGRVAMDGTATSFTLPAGTEPYEIATGSDGALWFSQDGGLGRITTSGQYSSVPLGYQTTFLTAAADGSIWFTRSGYIGHRTNSGAIEDFPVASGAYSLAADNVGNVWFVAGSNQIGRVSAQGEVDTFPSGHSQVNDVALGPDGNIWFVAMNYSPSSYWIASITQSGTVDSDPLPSNADALTLGPDGAFWLGYNALPGSIARYTVGGGYTSYPISDVDQVSVASLAAGPDGNVWAGEISRPNVIRVGTDAAAATVINTLVVSGAHTPGATETCNASLAPWLTSAPTLSTYRWYRDGVQIPGASTPTYVVASEDAGHQLSCGATGSYSIPSANFSLTSPAVAVPAPPPAVVPARQQLLTCKVKKSRVTCSRKLVAANYKLKNSGRYKVKSAKLTVKRKAVQVRVLVRPGSIRVLTPTVVKKGTYRLKVGRTARSLKVR